jgi:ribosomal protein S18 acetylase RimI-like enzyme
MIELRPTTIEDMDFLFDLHKAAMGDYVDQTWGWDDDWQREHFLNKFKPGMEQVILLEGETIGVISVERRQDEVFLGKISIHPRYQKSGIGTQLIQAVLDDAQDEGLPVGLRVLKVNPARGLYERLGFEIVGESETHFMMKAVPR